MLLTNSVMWFKPLNIAFSVGVDGISVVMILLSAIIVFTGTFASWQLEPMKKEYFLWFVLLSSGVFGFFISTDMFTMFMFYEVALIPMYLLIGVWGTGPKEYSAMKLTLMLMGGSASFGTRYPWYLLLQWCYHNGCNRVGTFARYAKGCTEYFLPIGVYWFRCTRCIVPIPHMVS